MVKILIVDDELIVRTSLKLQFQLEPNLQIVGEAANGEQAIEQAKLLQPDIVLMDLVMPEIDGLNAALRLRAECPNCKVIIHSIYDDPEVRAAAKAVGAIAFVAKSGSEDVLTAMRKLASENDS